MNCPGWRTTECSVREHNRMAFVIWKTNRDRSIVAKTPRRFRDQQLQLANVGRVHLESSSSTANYRSASVNTDETRWASALIRIADIAQCRARAEHVRHAIRHHREAGREFLRRQAGLERGVSRVRFPCALDQQVRERDQLRTQLRAFPQQAQRAHLHLGQALHAPASQGNYPRACCRANSSSAVLRLTSFSALSTRTISSPH